MILDKFISFNFPCIRSLIIIIIKNIFQIKIKDDINNFIIFILEHVELDSNNSKD